jgi:hypothetical protein
MSFGRYHQAGLQVGWKGRPPQAARLVTRTMHLLRGEVDGRPERYISGLSPCALRPQPQRVGPWTMI